MIDTVVLIAICVLVAFLSEMDVCRQTTRKDNTHNKE